LHDAVRKLNLTRSFFIQDYIADFDKAVDLIHHADETIEIYPKWLCPIRTFHASEKISPMNVPRDDILLDIGIYGRSKKYVADKLGKNKEIEMYATTHNAIKVLYAEVFYSEEDFWSIYDKNRYDVIRTNTKPKESFLIFGLRFIQKKILNQPLQQEFQNFFLKHCEVHLRRTHDLS
jgi:Delta24-sterol reductase